MVLGPNKPKPGGKGDSARTVSMVLRAIICLCLLSALVMTFFVVDIRLHTSPLMAWIDANPYTGFFVFLAFYAIGTGEPRPCPIRHVIRPPCSRHPCEASWRCCETQRT